MELSVTYLVFTNGATICNQFYLIQYDSVHSFNKKIKLQLQIKRFVKIIKTHEYILTLV